MIGIEEFRAIVNRYCDDTVHEGYEPSTPEAWAADLKVWIEEGGYANHG